MCRKRFLRHSIERLRCLPLSLCIVAAGGGIATAEDDIAQVAQRLIEATVTLRVHGSQEFMAASARRSEAGGDESLAAASEVIVCSGTYVGHNRVLSFGCPPVVTEAQPVQTEYRITLPAGGQATARPRVVDQRSGLVLLELDGNSPEELTPLVLADDLPQTGGTVLTAAASGVEEPLVSLGVLSGVDRVVPGTELPPLLVCDISTTAASSGAAVVDREARLIGIVAAAGLPGENFGWSYAVPLKEIRRVLDAHEDGRLVVLGRLRPSLGVVLGTGKDLGTVVVQHVIPGGPGEQAGLAQGDQILAIEGRQVRSVYQAGTILRKHLPGEEITLTRLPSAASQALVERQVSVTLGSQTESLTASLPADVQQQSIKARFTEPARIELSNSLRSYQFSLGPAAKGAAIQNGAIGPLDDKAPEPAAADHEQALLLLRQQAEQYRAQLAKMEQAIKALEDEVSRRRAPASPPPASRQQPNR